MKTYLVEEFSSDIEFDSSSLIIALTPEVCYQLDKEEIKYSIIEDYYDEVELSSEADDYRQSVNQWIGELDEFLQHNIKELKELNLKLATIYKWYLKRMILDPLYFRCYTLNRLFEAIKPSEVAYISHKPDEPHLNYRFEHYGRSYYSQVIPILCSKNNIPLASVFLGEDSKAVKQVKSAHSGKNLIAGLKGTLYKSEIIRRMLFIYKYLNKWLFTKRAKRQKLNIFMLQSLSDQIGRDFIIDALRNGHNIYQLSDDFIIKYSCLGARRYLDLKAECDKVTDSNNGIWEYTANLLDGHDLIKWANEKCQLDVSEIVLPRLRHFISKVCPEIIGYFKVFTEFYEKDEINILFTPAISPLSEYAALAAACSHQHVKTVCLFHGDSICLGKTWCIIELQNFNIHISSNIEAKEYFKHLGSEINSPAKLYSSPHRLLHIRKIGYLRGKRRSNIRKNRIIYLTTFMFWDTRKMDGIDYPDTWYYEFQKSLIEYFSTKREYTFVWKGLPTTDKIYNPIPNFIMDNNFSNIEVASNPFTEHLLSADRVICDYPSTGFYESIVVGVPTMSLYHKATIVRKSAVDYFGNLLKLYSDIPEAVKHIDEFLNSDPELYKRAIDVEDNSILDIFEEVDKKAN